MPFQGRRVLAFESRRAAEMAELIRRQGGVPFVAPALREAPVDDNAEIFRFAGRLFAGEFQMMLLLTGIGTRQLNRILAERYGESAFADALRRLTVVVRGPKPLAALRELGLAPTIVAPEPNTWRELMKAIEGRPESRIAVQEYGRPNPELLAALRTRGAEVTSVLVYRYALPEDLGPLRQAVRGLAAAEFQMALFTTAAQVGHLFQIAGELQMSDAVLAGLCKCVIGSIGPTTTEALEEFGLRPTFEASRPKMGLLVREAAERAHG